jgi:hypothetical protein
MKNQNRKPNPIEAYYHARERLRIAGSEDGEPLTIRVKNALAKTLEANRRPAASVRLALWEQRKKHTPLLQKSTSCTPHILEEQKGKEGSQLRVYLERAFSNPADYRFPPNPLSRAEKQEVLQYLVLDPSRIPDGLFLDLSGIAESDWTEKSVTEQLETKRSYIPSLKELFSESHQLMTHFHSGTGRIVRLPYHSLMPHVAGAYLVFQELQTLDPSRIQSRESRKNTVSVKMLPDIWSLARSQEYAAEALTQKIAVIRDCQESLMRIRVKYPDASESERRELIAEFTAKFNGKQAYAFKKIISVRKPRLRYTNSGTDGAVLMGMSNDLEKYHLETVSKGAQIRRQESLLRNAAESHALQFHRFFESLYRELSAFDSSDAEKRILETHEKCTEFNFLSGESFCIGKIWHQVKLFHDILSHPVSTGAPFFEIESRVVNAIAKIR